MHVDAAYGGPAIFSTEYAQADSVAPADPADRERSAPDFELMAPPSL